MTEHLPQNRTVLLAIDDDEGIHQLLDYNLEGVADEIRHALNGRQGLKLALEYKPDVILLDIDMPDLDGIQVARQLKEVDTTRDIPIIFLTGLEGTVQLARALDSGGSDYVTKPFEGLELQARVRVALRVKRLIDLLKTHGQVDLLSGLANREVFDRDVAVAWSAGERDGGELALLMLRIDGLKRINDEFGFQHGDDVIQSVAGLLQGESGQVFRLASSTFALIRPGTGESEALQLLASLQERIGQLRVPGIDADRPLTSSAGAVTVRFPAADGMTLDSFVANAKAQL